MLAALALMAAAPASATVVNISALNGIGTTVALAAGTYTVSPIGVAQGGAYNAYSPWSYTSGCDTSGMNCSTGWNYSFAIDYGQGADNFNRVNGSNYGYSAQELYATDLQALSSAQSGSFIVAPLSEYNIPADYVTVSQPITFTLARAQDVNFFITDSAYGDNRGGESLSVTSGVPEPAAWAMMIAGLAAIGAALRGRRRRVSPQYPR